MEFIKNLNDIVTNLLTLEGYLRSDNAAERQFAQDLVKNGKTILVYKVNGENHFAPSRWSGYRNNSMAAHQANGTKDGRETNPEIDGLIGKAFANATIEGKFLAYCVSLALEVPNNKRRFWRMPGIDERYLNLLIY